MMQYVLKAACIMSTDQVFFELVGKYSDTINYSDLFFAACRGGHVSVAQWIWTDAVVKGRPIDLTVEKRTANYQLTALSTACYHGHFDLVKWIGQMDPRTDVVHWNNNQASNVASLNGHREISDWLSQYQNCLMDLD